VPIFTEYSSLPFAAWLQDTRLGRKYALAFCYLLAAAFTLPIIFLKQHGFIVLIGLVKFMMTASFWMSYTLTSEVYDSKNRVNGLGCGSTISRVAGILLPIVCNWFQKFSIWRVYAVLAAVVLFAGFCHIFLPYDTKDRKLDQLEELDEG